MKKQFIIISFLFVSLFSAGNVYCDGKVIKVASLYFLIDTDSGIGKIGDKIFLKRSVGSEIVNVCTARLVKFQDGKAAAKVIFYSPGMTVRIGDFVITSNKEQVIAPSEKTETNQLKGDQLLTGDEKDSADSSQIFIRRNPAMFGLDWGMTPPQVLDLGIRLTYEQSDRNFEIYSTSSLPQNLKGSEDYKLLFDDTRGLVKIGMICRNIIDDPEGMKGKARFEMLASILERQYKEDKSAGLQASGLRVYKLPNEFYECLEYEGCGTWHKLFRGSNKVILLILKGIKHGIGFIELAVEASPAYAESMEDYESKPSGRNKFAD